MHISVPDLNSRHTKLLVQFNLDPWVIFLSSMRHAGELIHINWSIDSVNSFWSIKAVGVGAFPNGWHCYISSYNRQDLCLKFNTMFAIHDKSLYFITVLNTGLSHYSILLEYPIQYPILNTQYNTQYSIQYPILNTILNTQYNTPILNTIPNTQYNT